MIQPFYEENNKARIVWHFRSKDESESEFLLAPAATAGQPCDCYKRISLNKRWERRLGVKRESEPLQLRPLWQWQWHCCSSWSSPSYHHQLQSPASRSSQVLRTPPQLYLKESDADGDIVLVGTSLHKKWTLMSQFYRLVILCHPPTLSIFKQFLSRQKSNRNSRDSTWLWCNSILWLLHQPTWANKSCYSPKKEKSFHMSLRLTLLVRFRVSRVQNT